MYTTNGRAGAGQIFMLLGTGRLRDRNSAHKRIWAVAKAGHRKIGGPERIGDVNWRPAHRITCLVLGLVVTSTRALKACVAAGAGVCWRNQPESGLFRRGFQSSALPPHPGPLGVGAGGTIPSCPEPPGNRFEAIEKLPPDATFEDAIERLIFLAKIEAGITELDAGEGIPHDELKRRLGAWG